MQNPALEQARSELSEIAGIEAIEPLFPTLIDDKGAFIKGESPLPWGLSVKASKVLESTEKRDALISATRKALLVVVEDTDSNRGSAFQTELERDLEWHTDGWYDRADEPVKSLHRSGALKPRKTRTGFALIDNPDFQTIFWDKLCTQLEITRAQFEKTFTNHPLIQSLIQSGRTDVPPFESSSQDTNELSPLVTEFLDLKYGKAGVTAAQKSPLQIFGRKNDLLLNEVNQAVCQQGLAYFHEYTNGADQELFWLDASTSTAQSPHLIHCAWHKN
jgi:hypothetical protein